MLQLLSIKWWGRGDLNPRDCSQRILSPLRLPISPRPQLEVPIRFELMITELQSIALPLGYGTIPIYLFYNEWWGRGDLNPTGLLPTDFKSVASAYFATAPKLFIARLLY